MKCSSLPGWTIRSRFSTIFKSFFIDKPRERAKVYPSHLKFTTCLQRGSSTHHCTRECGFGKKTRKFYKEFFLPPRNGHENAVSAKNWENFIKKIIPPTPCWSFWEPNDEKTDKIHKLFAPPQRQATGRGLFCIGNEKFDVSLRNGHENAVLPKKRENFINKFFLPPPVGVF